jgi:tetratricopeptide (TPR) repeat protein
LADALTAATEGGGHLLLLAGEAGIGKTTTARELAARARRTGVTVRWSACSAGGATVAHGPWLTVLSGLGEPGRRAIGALVGSEAGESADAAAARAGAYAAVVTALEQATAERPALLVLDDLHWADEGTLQLLDVVAAHLPGLPVLVVGTYRDTDTTGSSPLRRMGGRAEHLPLRGLDEAAVGALLGDQVGVERGAALAPEVLRLTAGNPFLVVQLARLANEGTALAPGALPSGARDLLQQRLAALDDEDRAVLEGGAVLGSPFRRAELDEVVARPPEAVAASLDRAARRRIVERAPGTGSWAFVHDLFRQAVLDAMAPAARAARHRAAAAALEAHDAEAAAVAAQRLAATALDGADAEAAAAWSVRAGDRALAAMAWEEAAGHHERALAVLPAGPEATTRGAALLGLGRARLLSGDVAGAARAFDELAALARAEGSAARLAEAALAFSADLSGFEVRLFDQHQIDLLEEAAAALEATGEPARRAMVLARLSVASSMTTSDDRRRALADEAVALARSAGDPVVLARALAAHCDAISGPDHSEAREAEASEILALAEAGGDGPLELMARRLRWVARLEQGDVAGVEEDAGAFARRAEALGNPLYSWYVPLWQAQAAVVAGRPAEAERLLARVEAIGAQAGSLNAPMLATVLRLHLFWSTGDHTGARAAFEALGEESPELAVHLSSIGGAALAHALAGDRATAVAYLERALALGLDQLPMDAEWLPNLVTYVRAGVVCGHRSVADALPRLEPYAHRVAFEGIGAGLYGSVAETVARGCLALGRLDDAVAYAEQGAEVGHRFGGLVAADALRTLARCRAARGGPGDAEAAAAADADADAAYAALGATHQRSGGPGPAPATGPVEEAPGNELRREGEVWHVTYGGRAVVVRHSKGLADLAVLLARPGQEVHVSDLEGVPAAAVGGRGDDALDRRALEAYKGRLVELAEELEEAEADHDLARAERARVEYDALVDQLTGAVGLGGRARAAGPDPVDRLRKAVSARIRDAIRRIEGVHEPLGRHLANAVHTGTWCAYRPEGPTVWRCQTGSGAPRA